MKKELDVMCKVNLDVLVDYLGSELNHKELRAFIYKLDMYVSEVSFTQKLVDHLSKSLTKENVLDCCWACAGTGAVINWQGASIECPKCRP